MPFVSECPSCGQKLKVPDNLSGKRVKCSKCASVFVAESVTATPPAAAPPPSRRRDEEPDERLDDEPTDNGDYEDEGRPSRRRSRRGGGAAGRGGMLLTFGIVSIAMAVVSVLSVLLCNMIVPLLGSIGGALFVIVGLVFGIMAWLMGSGDLKKIRAGTIDRAAEGGTKGGYITGIVGTILNLLTLICGCILLILGAVGFAVLAGAAANQQKNNPGFGNPARRSFQLPLPKLAEYLPNRGR